MRADLHVHSKYSRRPSQWFLQKIGCPESFTEPLDLYHIARNRGMSLVTITDHNRIDGALQIAHLPGAFISEEVTSYFPGDFNSEANEYLKQILSGLCRKDIIHLADKHDFLPAVPEPWNKTLVGGSDDHSSLNIARTFTEVTEADSINAFLKGIDCGKTKIISKPSSPQSLAHNLYSIAYQFYRHKLGLGNYVLKNEVFNFINRCLRADQGEPAGFFNKLHILRQYRRQKKIAGSIPDTMVELLRKETAKLLAENPRIFLIPQEGDSNYQDSEQQWFVFVKEISNRVLLKFASHLLDHFSGANLFNLFHTIGSAGGFYTLPAPYFVAFATFSRHRHFQYMVEKEFQKDDIGTAKTVLNENVAIFTDTYDSINDVTLALQQQSSSAAQSEQKLTVVSCDGEKRTDTIGIQNFRPIGVYNFADDPESKLFYPPLLELLDFCYRQNFTRIHAATPGPMGMAALLIAKLLKLPIDGTYHTSLPRYAQFVTGDAFMEELAWKYTTWFYNQIGQIYVPSQSTFDELVQKGIDQEKIHLFPNGVEYEKFHSERFELFSEKQINA
jgi:glycosyltransferase involved in cell wall biosynthesis